MPIPVLGTIPSLFYVSLFLNSLPNSIVISKMNFQILRYIRTSFGVWEENIRIKILFCFLIFF